MMAVLSLRPYVNGGPINAGLLMLALVYGALGVFLSPMLVGRMFRADQATGRSRL